MLRGPLVKLLETSLLFSLQVGLHRKGTSNALAAPHLSHLVLQAEEHSRTILAALAHRTLTTQSASEQPVMSPCNCGSHATSPKSFPEQGKRAVSLLFLYVQYRVILACMMITIRLLSLSLCPLVGYQLLQEKVSVTLSSLSFVLG